MSRDKDKEWDQIEEQWKESHRKITSTTRAASFKTRKLINKLKPIHKLKIH